MTDEIFGPVLPIRTVPSTDDAIAFINDRDKPLALYVFSGDDAVTERVLAETSSGGAAVNATLFQVSAPELPFGASARAGWARTTGAPASRCSATRRACCVAPRVPIRT